MLWLPRNLTTSPATTKEKKVYFLSHEEDQLRQTAPKNLLDRHQHSPKKGAKNGTIPYKTLTKTNMDSSKKVAYILKKNL